MMKRKQKSLRFYYELKISKSNLRKKVSQSFFVPIPNLPLMKGNRVYLDWIVCISTKEIDPSKFDYYTIRINLNDKKCYIFTQYNYAIKTNHIYRDIIGIKKNPLT